MLKFLEPGKLFFNSCLIPEFPNLFGFAVWLGGKGMVLRAWWTSMCTASFARVVGRCTCHSRKWSTCTSCLHKQDACVSFVKGSKPGSGPRHGGWGTLAYTSLFVQAKIIISKRMLFVQKCMFLALDFKAKILKEDNEYSIKIHTITIFGFIFTLKPCGFDFSLSQNFLFS